MRATLAIVLAVSVFAQQQPIVGPGCTTPKIIDWDCDGYGQGERTAGPDADDADATVNTTESAIAKYGTVLAYLRSRGYNPLRILYVSPAAVAAGVPNDSTQPYSQASSYSAGQAGDAIVYRGGVYTNSPRVTRDGTELAPIVMVAYPGEQPYINYAPNAVNFGSRSWQIFDGFRHESPNGLGDGIAGHFGRHIVVRNVHTNNSGRGAFFSVGEDILLEKNVIRNSRNSHNLYPGSSAANNVTERVLSGLKVRYNLMYGTAMHNVHLNGPSPNFEFVGNYMAANSGMNIKLDNTGTVGGLIQSNIMVDAAYGCVGGNAYSSYETIHSRSVSNVKVLDNICIVKAQNSLGINSGRANGAIWLHSANADSNALARGSTQDLAHSAWTRTGATVAANTHDTLKMIGTFHEWAAAYRKNADTLVEDTSTGRHGIAQTVGPLKASGSLRLWIQGRTKPGARLIGVTVTDSTGVERVNVYNPATRTWVKTATGYQINATNEFDPFPDNWIRFHIGAQVAAGPVTIGYYLADAAGNLEYAGDGSTGMPLWALDASYNADYTYVGPYSVPEFSHQVGAGWVVENNIIATDNVAMLALGGGAAGRGWESGTWRRNVFLHKPGAPINNAVARCTDWSRVNQAGCRNEFTDYVYATPAQFATLGPAFEAPSQDLSTLQKDQQQMKLALALLAASGFVVAQEPTTPPPPCVIAYSAEALPPGLVLDSATGAISGTPTTAGDYFVVLTATCGTAKATKTVPVKVKPKSVSVTIATAALPDGEVGQMYAATVQASAQ
jgi:hypothetical protein